MKLAEHEVYILNSPADGYENVEFILIDVNSAVETKVSKDQVIDGIKKLIQNGLFDAFEYDAKKSDFIRIGFDQIQDIESLWFLMTERGRQVLDENWTDEFIKKWE
jgi:hypothetical protein